MGTFEYVMALVSIVVGLGITHILAAFGTAVHRLRGHGPPIELHAVYLLWMLFVFSWLISFWWFEYRLQGLDFEWTFARYLFTILYAIALFLLAVLLVPDRMDGLTNSYEYFMAGRSWFFALLFATSAGIDVVDTFLKGNSWAFRPVYIGWVATMVAVCAAGALSSRRGVQLVVALVALGCQLALQFREVGILG